MNLYTRLKFFLKYGKFNDTILRIEYPDGKHADLKIDDEQVTIDEPNVIVKLRYPRKAIEAITGRKLVIYDQ